MIDLGRESNGIEIISCWTPSSSVSFEAAFQRYPGGLQTSVVKFDGKRDHAEQGKAGMMSSSCNVDGKCDVSSGFVSKSLSIKSGTCNQVNDFGSCSRRFLDDTGVLEYFGRLLKLNFRIEGGRRGTNKSSPSNEKVTKDFKDRGSFETNEVVDKSNS